jgi:hypothetical protein
MIPTRDKENTLTSRIKAKEENDIFLVKTLIENKLTDQQNQVMNKRKQNKDN